MFKMCIEHLYARSRIKFSVNVDLSYNRIRTRYAFFHFPCRIFLVNSLIKLAIAYLFFDSNDFEKHVKRSIAKLCECLRQFADSLFRNVLQLARIFWSIWKFSLINIERLKIKIIDIIVKCLVFSLMLRFNFLYQSFKNRRKAGTSHESWNASNPFKISNEEEVPPRPVF